MQIWNEITEFISPALFLLSLLSLPFFFLSPRSPFFSQKFRSVRTTVEKRKKARPGTRKKFAISHLLRVHRDATDGGRAAFRAAHTALAHLQTETPFFSRFSTNRCKHLIARSSRMRDRSTMRSFSIFREALSLSLFFLSFLFSPPVSLAIVRPEYRFPVVRIRIATPFLLPPPPPLCLISRCSISRIQNVHLGD